MIAKDFLFWTLVVFQLRKSEAELAVAKLFSSGMVLQEAPSRAALFGTYSEAPVIVSLLCDSFEEPVSLEAELDDMNLRWLATLPPVSSFSSCNISITSGAEEILLEEVLFGDVWFCAGQSNMGWALGGIENNTEEMDDGQAETSLSMAELNTSVILIIMSLT